MPHKQTPFLIQFGYKDKKNSLALTLIKQLFFVILYYYTNKRGQIIIINGVTLAIF